MKGYLSAIWLRYSPRQRRLLRLLGVLLCTMVLWLGLWSPLQNLIARQQQRIAQHQNELILMQQIAALPQRPTLNHNAASQSVESQISQSARANGITPQRIESGADGVRIDLPNTSFSGLLTWLTMLEKNADVRIHILDIKAEPAAKGMVQINQLLIKRTQDE